ncbi:hypothetical protein ACJ41O_008495 [Fusarium nematophilum]
MTTYTVAADTDSLPSDGSPMLTRLIYDTSSLQDRLYQRATASAGVDEGASANREVSSCKPVDPEPNDDALTKPKEE